MISTCIGLDLEEDAIADDILLSGDGGLGRCVLSLLFVVVMSWRA